jgi:hypothetical protein
MLADPRGGLRLIASSDERMRLLELFELQDAQGPCLDAFSSGRAVQDRRIGRALAGIDMPAGQFPVAGVTAAHQQHPPGDVADRGEGARGHAAGGGGLWLMVILAADARPPGPRPVPAAGRADRARGPVRPGRGTRARNAQTPHRIAGVLIRMIAGPLRVRHA